MLFTLMLHSTPFQTKSLGQVRSNLWICSEFSKRLSIKWLLYIFFFDEWYFQVIMDREIRRPWCICQSLDYLNIRLFETKIFSHSIGWYILFRHFNQGACFPFYCEGNLHWFPFVDIVSPFWCQFLKSYKCCWRFSEAVVVFPLREKRDTSSSTKAIVVLKFPGISEE